MKIFFLVLLIFLLFNCEPENTDPVIIDNATGSYFPISPGKSLIYEYNYSHLSSSLKETDYVTFQHYTDNNTLATTEIIGERMFQSVSFSRIDDDIIQYNGGRGHAYVPPPTEGAGEGILDYIDSPRKVIYDSVVINDSWQEDNNVSTAASIEDIAIDNYIYKNCIKIVTMYENGDQRETYFAKAIGIVKLIYTESSTGYVKTFNYMETINAESGFISGSVSLDGSPLEGLVVSITGDGYCNVTTGSNGLFSLPVYGGGLLIYFIKDINTNGIMDDNVDIAFGRDFIGPNEQYTFNFNTGDADYYYPDDLVN